MILGLFPPMFLLIPAAYCFEAGAGAGIMVSGGFGDGQESVEIVVPATGQFCSLPNLPDEYRYYHTMNGFYLCGGKRSNCLVLSEGEWNKYYEMEESFEGHSSWETDSGIFLLGGWQ